MGSVTLEEVTVTLLDTVGLCVPCAAAKILG